ncbi:MAG: SET domain-containing methyltransferase [Gemmatimonadales bacterium]|jgi:hypothetical protein
MADVTRSDVPVARSSVESRSNGDGHRRLIATHPIAAGGEIVQIRGTVRTSPSRFSIQVGPRRHLDEMGPVNATNHSCAPNAFVDFSHPERLVLRALRDIDAGDEITIHYCATEYDMAEPFECGCGAASCVGMVRGYRHLPAGAAAELELRLSPAIRALARTRPKIPEMELPLD